jgi:hypothetical protein
MPKLYDKDQAAKFLGVSVRTLQRRMSANAIAFTTRRTKTGDEVVFTADELKRHKREFTEVKAIVSPSVSPTSESVTPRPDDAPSGDQVSLAVLQSAPLEMWKAAPADFWKALAKGITRTSNPARVQKTTAELAHKLLLSIPEAARLSGIPIDKLRAAVNSGELATVSGIGRGLGKIKRSDLDLFIKKL